MSVTGLSSDPNRLCKNSFHWRNDSGELDVFEAARYFSGANENPGYNNAAMFSENFIREDRRGARMSLDMPMMRNPMISNSDNLAMVQKQLKENNKKYKQPSSPGGRLASFLNSLFNQTTSKKKKKKSKSGSTTKDLEEESPGGRKRRSSISHFRITTSNSANDSKSSMYSSSSSGFITPPTYAKTPTKSSYKEFRSFADQQKAVKNGTNAEKRSTDCAWLEDEEFRFSNGNVFKNGSFRNSNTNWADDEEIRGFRKFSDVDDGADTDSSSDLFDLPNHELDFYSSGLPVYGTTHMDRIRIGAPISSAATV